MNAPKRIYAWSVPPTAHLVGTWSVTRYPDAAQEYILASDHARIVAEKDAEIARLREVLDDARVACRIVDAAARSGHEKIGDLVLHMLSAVEPARAALKGDSDE